MPSIWCRVGRSDAHTLATSGPWRLRPCRRETDPWLRGIDGRAAIALQSGIFGGRDEISGRSACRSLLRPLPGRKHSRTSRPLRHRLRSAGRDRPLGRSLTRSSRYNGTVGRGRTLLPASAPRSPSGSVRPSPRALGRPVAPAQSGVAPHLGPASHGVPAAASRRLRPVKR